MRYIFSLGLFMLLGTLCLAQKSYRFESLTVDDGLSQSGVICMVQDKLGYLWIGTQDGLNKYDGYSFEVYRHKADDSTSLPKNYITHLFIDPNDNLWVATYGHLSKYNVTTGAFTNFALKIDGALSWLQHGIFPCKDGSFALSTDKGLFFFNPKTGDVFTKEEFKSLSKINSYVETKSMGEWVFGERTINKPPGKNSWEERDESGFPYYHEGNDVLLLDVGNRILKLNNDKNTWDRIVNHGGTSLMLLDGSIWTENVTDVSICDSLGRVQQKIPGHAIVPGSTSLYVRCIYQTRDGAVWIGTQGYGLKKYNAQTNLFGYIGASPYADVRISHGYVDAIYTPNDTILYVATQSGLDVINLAENISKKIPSPSRIVRMTMDKKGILWCVAIEGLYFLQKNQLVKVNGWASLMEKTSLPGHVDINWVKNVIKNVGARFQDLFFVATLSEDSLWINRSGFSKVIELSIANVNTGKIIKSFNYDPSDPMTAPFSRGIKLIWKDSQKNIWIGSNSEGLCLYNPKDENFTHFSEKDGLPNNVVYGILEDDNENLWLSTNKGLCEFNTKTKRVRNFDVHDGLQSNEFNTGAYFKSASGKMYFGGINGLTYFDPNDIVITNTIPQSTISGFYVNNVLLRDYSEYVRQDSRKANQIFELEYNERDFGFDVVGIGFSLPGRTRYRYILENYDNQWHDIGNLRHVSFTNIPPGDYVFRIQSSDSYGNWETTGASIMVTIQAPFWANRWVWLGSGIFIIISIGLVYYYKVNQLKWQTKKLEKIVGERTQKIQQQKNQIEAQNEELLAQATYLQEKNIELEKAKGLLEIEVKYVHQQQLLKSSIQTQEEERKRIAQDLHDELGAVLSISRMHLVQIQNQNASPESIQTGLQQAKMLTETALATMRRISHDLMPPQLEMFGLVKTLETITTQIQDTQKIAVHFHASDDIGRWSLPIELGLYRVCMEMVNNTIKHAEATRIDINLRQLADHISFSYSDNGKGLPNVINVGHGLKNIEARVNSIGGEVEIGNRESGGFYATVKIFSK